MVDIGEPKLPHLPPVASLGESESAFEDLVNRDSFYEIVPDDPLIEPP